MSKILNVDDLLEAGEFLLPPDEFRGIETSIIIMVKCLAERLAMECGIELHDVSNQPGFAGLCASFRGGLARNAKADTVGDLDPSGEWDD